MLLPCFLVRFYRFFRKLFAWKCIWFFTFLNHKFTWTMSGLLKFQAESKNLFEYELISVLLLKPSTFDFYFLSFPFPFSMHFQCHCNLLRWINLYMKTKVFYSFCLTFVFKIHLKFSPSLDLFTCFKNLFEAWYLCCF